MPSASNEQRALMGKYFNNGGINDWEPLAFLLDAGYTERGGWFTKPNPEHAPTQKELNCLNFLCDEWDYAYDFTKKENPNASSL